MTPLSELGLYHLPLEDPALASDPLPYFAAARAKHPWLATSSFGTIVHEFSAQNELLRRDDQLRTSFDGVVEIMGAHGTAWGRFTEEQMIAAPADQHRRMRDIFTPRFTPRQADGMRHLMRAVIADLLDEWAPKGSFDFEEFASYFPISVLCRMIGAPVEAIPALRKSMEAMGLAFSMDPSRLPALEEAIGVLDEFVGALVRERLATPSPEGASDLLDMLIEAGDAGGITERQLADLLIFLLVAGYDTSKNVLTYTMLLMIRHPDIYARCAGDGDYCRKVIEEALRYFSPASTFRATIEDLVYRDVLLPKDTMLLFPLSISGHDPGVFPQPDRFDPERKLDAEHRHLAFGRGKHICMGQYIARAQLQEGLNLIAHRLRDPRLDGDFGWRPFPGVWGLKGLPIAFTPAPPA